MIAEDLAQLPQRARTGTDFRSTSHRLAPLIERFALQQHGDDHYRIVIAVAGLVEQDLDIQVEKGVLTVAGDKRESNEDVTYLHQGVAKRAFRLSFRLMDHIEVQGAKLANGLLNIDLLRVVPEEAKPKRIMIGGAESADSKPVSEQ